jgi:hypothetical protein
MDTNLRVFGYENESVNGTNIKDQGFDLNYNGDYADLNVYANGNVKYQRLTKQDILDMMNIPSSTKTLEEKLLEYQSQLDSTPQYQIVPMHRYSRRKYKHHPMKKHTNHSRRVSKNSNSSKLRKTNKSSRLSRTKTRSNKTISKKTIPSIEEVIY